MLTLHDLQSFLLQLLAYGGGAATVAYLIFQFLGKSWVEAKFAERLDSLKHLQTLEIQRLRIEIDGLVSGVLKLQEREFEILPAAWRLLDEAKGQVAWLVSPLQTYPDLDRMNDTVFEEFIAGTELSGSQKNEIRNSGSRLSAYQKIIFWHRLAKVQRTHFELQSYVAMHAIFLPLELKEKYEKICKLMRSSLASKEVGHQHGDYKLETESWDKLQKEIEPLYQQIEFESRARLRAHAESADA